MMIEWRTDCQSRWHAAVRSAGRGCRPWWCTRSHRLKFCPPCPVGVAEAAGMSAVAVGPGARETWRLGGWRVAWRGGARRHTQGYVARRGVILGEATVDHRSWLPCPVSGVLAPVCGSGGLGALRQPGSGCLACGRGFLARGAWAMGYLRLSGDGAGLLARDAWGGPPGLGDPAREPGSPPVWPSRPLPSTPVVLAVVPHSRLYSPMGPRWHLLVSYWPLFVGLRRVLLHYDTQEGKINRGKRRALNDTNTNRGMQNVEPSANELIAITVHKG